MAEPFKLTRIPSLKTVDDFRKHCATLGIELPCEDAIETGASSPLAQPVAGVTINGKRIGNRIAIHPMEGWDGTTSGGVTDEMRRRWQRFGESGAKLICGAEAMAVRPDGRANPNQLIIIEQNKAGLAELMGILKKAHAERYGTADDLVIGFQLTHSGRFCRPNDKKRWESRVAFRHPILDKKFNVTSDEQILSDGEVEELIECYIRAAKIAWDVGADFVDLKHCHGYLLHEFLGAHTRPGKFGGSFENRTRILRKVVAGIRASGNKIEFGVRLSTFDMVPHRPDPALSVPGKLGPGIPEEHAHALPYRYGFGVNQSDPIQIDLTETFLFAELCAQLGVKILNTSAGSPYYTPHLQRPAAYPPSDGYQPAHDPLIDVERQVQVVRQLRTKAPKDMVIVGSGLSYLQEYLPHVSQYLLRHGWADIVGIGRVVLSYPTMLADAAQKGELEKKFICRTFSDCTTAPRNGLISGCYPLDKYYTAKPEAALLKEIKKRVGA
ncbi:MAG TPA: NADH:flavin oxidoreductase [Verrucomicrobiae bacterium]|jgi:2,4-dienoyl-CoA reductase-like NADH-dependent reductase (Old Yellow Enzyme family)